MRAILPFLLWLLFLAPARSRIHPALPEPGSLDGLGVNIHFSTPLPGELAMMRAAGLRWVRTDLTWAGTEPEAGKYDFAKYDGLLAELDRHGLRAYFILDYGHPRYAEPGDRPPFTSRAGTPEFRDAYARWVVAAVQHFKGRGCVWELWNEPNLAGFWKPQPKAEDYLALIKTTVAAMRTAGLRADPLSPTYFDAPGECLIAGATSRVDLKFLETCFAGGLLDWVDAVSVHPYRQNAPETVAAEYQALRTLIRRYAPTDTMPVGSLDPDRPKPRRHIPILAGEWGYSTGWKDLTEDLQAKYLARLLLTNAHQQIPITIWYDWRDDGDSPQEPEHRFGLVHRKPTGDEKRPFDPKPAYTALKTLTEELRGLKFDKQLTGRVWPSDPLPHLQLWADEKRLTVVAWRSHPKQEGTWELFGGQHPSRGVDFLGSKIGPQFVPWNETGGAPAPGLDPGPAPTKNEFAHEHPDWRKDPWKYPATDAPIYRRMAQEEPLVQILRGWRALPLEIIGHAPRALKVEVEFTNRLKHRLFMNGWNHLDELVLGQLWPLDLRAEYYANHAIWAAPGETIRRQVEGSILRSEDPPVVAVPFECVFGRDRVLVFQQVNKAPLNPIAFRFVGALGGGEVPTMTRKEEKEYEALAKAAGLIGPFKTVTRPKPLQYFFEISNPSGEALSATASLTNGGPCITSWYGTGKVTIAPSELRKIVQLDRPEREDGPIYGPVLGLGGKDIYYGSAYLPLNSIQVPPFWEPAQLRVLADGDPKIASEQSFSVALPPEGPPLRFSPKIPEPGESGAPPPPGELPPPTSPAFGDLSFRLDYRFSPGWKFLRLELANEAARKIAGKPHAFGLWVHGDGQGGVPNIRFRDASGRVFQVRGEPITWKGWRFLTWPLQPGEDPTRTGPNATEQAVTWSHWDGPNDLPDAPIQYPIQWDTLFLLDGTRQELKGTLHLYGPVVIYGTENYRAGFTNPSGTPP